MRLFTMAILVAGLLAFPEWHWRKRLAPGQDKAKWAKV